MASYNYLKFKDKISKNKVNVTTLRKEAKNLEKSEKRNTLFMVFVAIILFMFSGYVISL